MNRNTVNAARDAAIRFLDRANALLKDKGFDPDYTKRDKLAPYDIFPNVKTAALRRVSMDLTRDLAAMRRPS